MERIKWNELMGNIFDLYDKAGDLHSRFSGILSYRGVVSRSEILIISIIISYYVQEISVFFVIFLTCLFLNFFRYGAALVGLLSALAYGVAGFYFFFIGYFAPMKEHWSAYPLAFTAGLLVAGYFVRYRVLIYFGWKRGRKLNGSGIIWTGDPVFDTRIDKVYALDQRRKKESLSYEWLVEQCRKKKLMMELEFYNLKEDLNREREKVSSEADYFQGSKGEEKSAPDETKNKRYDPYEILGLEKGTSSGAVKSRYRELIKLYHPDKVSHLGNELKELAHNKTIQIKQAYDEIYKK